MNGWRKLMLVLVTLATCVLVAGVAYAGTGGSTSKAPTLGKVTPSKAKTKSEQPRQAPGRGESESQSESESGGDSEQGQPGEPAQGHEDPPGDVNHECTGDCQE